MPCLDVKPGQGLFFYCIVSSYTTNLTPHGPTPTKLSPYQIEQVFFRSFCRIPPAAPIWSLHIRLYDRPL
jgi:hypothetical protein